MAALHLEEARARTRVTVADLDLAFREPARDYLASLGFRANVVTDRAALDALPPGGDQILLVDIRLAGSDPRGFMSRLRDRHPAAEVLVSTGYLTIEQAVAALHAGAFDIVQKPPVWERLSRTMDIVLERRALTSRTVQPPRRLPVPSSSVSDDAPLVLYENLIGLVPAFAYIRVLLTGGLGELADEQREALKAIADGLDWLKRRIRNHLKNASKDPMGFPVNPEVVEVQALVEWSVEMFRPLAYECGIELTFHGGQPTTVFVDRDRLVLVLSALVLNAIEYSRGGAEVAVEVREEPRAVSVVVSDSGVGIPEDYQGQIFERFFKVPGEDRPRTDGLGLGLSSALLNAVLLESELAFASTPGQGSTFSLTLPRAPARGG